MTNEVNEVPTMLLLGIIGIIVAMSERESRVYFCSAIRDYWWWIIAMAKERIQNG